MPPRQMHGPGSPNAMSWASTKTLYESADRTPGGLTFFPRRRMTIFQAIVLGLVQGLTEFLPVSSSAHLALAPWVLGWQDPGLAFDVALHLGSLAAVAWYFRRDWVQLIGAAAGAGCARVARPTMRRAARAAPRRRDDPRGRGWSPAQGLCRDGVPAPGHHRVHADPARRDPLARWTAARRRRATSTR